MKQKINVLENYNFPLYEEDKVRQILDNINFLNNNFKTEVDICRSRHSAIFETASTYLSTVISRLSPTTHPSSGRHGQRWQVNSASIVETGVRGGLFEGIGGRGGGG